MLPAAVAPASSGGSRRLPGPGAFPLKTGRAPGRAGSRRSLSLFIHLTDGAEWFASQMLREAVEIQSQQKKGKSQENSGVARWTVGSQVIKSVTQHHIKQQAGTNREDPPGRLADRHAA